MRRVGATLDEFGDFLRLGLLLILDRNPMSPPHGKVPRRP
jgi:hypothetical protein